MPSTRDVSQSPESSCHKIPGSSSHDAGLDRNVDQIRIGQRAEQARFDEAFVIFVCEARLPLAGWMSHLTSSLRSR
ncbi:hypothetical protein GPL17_30155 [Bradyrhizobium yuanmingense]|uniref:hypothetical protein n=1 Tax=Bradyrhizobium yuanmingense TaxID=108015 RepID=UPI0012F9F8FA|nr:hypothetical protein [Bradyrhizobium yuanmingense]MVT54720.1 hypothetical protein [Bradyrhizobium yuanmingense]